MSLKRILMGTVAVVFLVITAVVAARDVRVDNTTCGNAIVTRNPLETIVRTGNLVDDALTEDRLTKMCGRGIARQRILTTIPLGIGVAAIVVGRQWRNDDEQRERDGF